MQDACSGNAMCCFHAYLGKQSSSQHEIIRMCHIGDYIKLQCVLNLFYISQYILIAAIAVILIADFPAMLSQNHVITFLLHLHQEIHMIIHILHLIADLNIDFILKSPLQIPNRIQIFVFLFIEHTASGQVHFRVRDMFTKAQCGKPCIDCTVDILDIQSFRMSAACSVCMKIKFLFVHKRTSFSIVYRKSMCLPIT